MTASTKTRCMLGHEPLLALRRKGRKPVAGVLIDAGSLGPWLGNPGRKNTDRSMAHVWLYPKQRAEAMDLRFAHRLPVLLAVEAWIEKGAVRTLVQSVLAVEPASLTLLRLGPDMAAADPWVSPLAPIDAFDVQPDGKPVRCCEQTAYQRAIS
jgi:hypothetical protein